MQISFSGKCVVITGGAGGFGSHMVSTFASLGAQVYTSDMNEVALNKNRGENIHSEVVDITDRKAATEWVGRIEKQHGGAIDVLINNAGGILGITSRPIDEVLDEEWDQIVDINLNAVFAICRAVAGKMKQAGGGKIVNISSVSGKKTTQNGIQAYCASKHAVVGLTTQLAVELGPFGINVNSVAPGIALMSERQKARWDGYTEEHRQAFLNRVSMRRLGTPEDITNGVLFFSSSMSDYVTGELLCVSGGA